MTRARGPYRRRLKDDEVAFAILWLRRGYPLEMVAARFDRSVRSMRVSANNWGIHMLEVCRELGRLKKAA